MKHQFSRPHTCFASKYLLDKDIDILLTESQNTPFILEKSLDGFAV